MTNLLLTFTASLVIVTATASVAKADSIWVKGAPADAIVNPLVAVGMASPYTHEYFSTGVTACSKLFDDRGDYFPNGKIGDLRW